MRKPHYSIFLAIPLMVITSVTAGAATITLHADGGGDYPNIQAAIDAAGDGDYILLESGIYSGSGNRDIRFHGKSLTLSSASGDPRDCIIDCKGSKAEPRRGFIFDSGEGLGTVLRGITITGGSTSGSWPEDAGGGIYCSDQTSPSIENCILRGNHSGNGAGLCCDRGSSPAIISCAFDHNAADYYGGAIYCYDGSSPQIEDCSVIGNSAGYYGGGLRSVNSAPSIVGCTFTGNRAGYGGSGLAFSGASTADILRCTITENRGSGDGGGIYCYYSSPSVQNTLIASNDAEGVFVYGNIAPQFSKCDIHGNERGDWTAAIFGQLGRSSNLSEDPQFCLDQDSGSFFVQSDSPCASGNQAHEEAIGAWGVGCQDFKAEEISWSALKALH